MVVGFDASRAFIPDRTGTENYSYQLSKALAKIDKKNQYLVYLRSQGPTLQVWPDNFQFKEIHWPGLWTQGGLALQTFKDQLDVLFVPAHTLPIIRKPGLKTVVTVHDLGSEYLPKTHQLKQRLYLSFMQRYQLKKATKLIAVSEATKKDLVNRIGINPEKITVIYEGFDKKTFKLIKGDTLINSLRQYKLKIGEYFLFVGTIQPRKNLTKLIEAFAKYLTIDDRKIEDSTLKMEDRELKRENPSSNINSQKTTFYSLPFTVNLVIVGQKGWLSDELYKLPRKLGIEDKVKFLGYVADRDLPALYSGAQALVFPSLFEGFGLPIIEAQACGCPVITSNVSSMPEVAGKGAILVNPYDIDDIVKGMERVKGKGERGKLIEEGFKNVKRFSWEKCARETLAVLEQTKKLSS